MKFDQDHLEDVPGYLKDSHLTLNFFFAPKHFNNGKIDSHLVFFRGFCRELNPKYCMLFDIGTEAKP
jgi:chitin synthase